MSRLPRDVTGERLVKALERLGYSILRQTGSHIRMSSGQGGHDKLTIPCHNPLKVGTLSGILDEVATQTGLTRDQLLEALRI